jgi:DNA invertase Pin-like site-specific DNA recombinase
MSASNGKHASNGNGKALRVAGYCRTSGEGQRDNTSIPTQKDDIIRFVKAMGWVLVKFYIDEARSGAKIAGREAFQQMMRDAANGKFDVIVVFDTTRFGRDGFDILSSSRTLKTDFGVDVLDCKGRFDTRERGRVLMNFVEAGVAEDERLRIMRRTKLGRLRKAKELHSPMMCKRPYGRKWTWDSPKHQSGSWSINPECQQLVQEVAARYLAGEAMPKLAKEVGINHAQLHRILTKKCGPVWDQRCDCDELDIHEVVHTPVPPLLDAATIKAVVARAEANRTYLHRPPQQVHTYLLSGHVFCAACGYAMFGEVSQGIRYYRHPTTERKRVCPVRPRPWVQAKRLEEEVVRRLFNLFGNPAAIERAVQDALPKVDEERRRQRDLQGKLEGVQRAKKSILSLVARELITDADAASQLGDLKDREGLLAGELEQLEATLQHVPDPDAVRRYVEKIDDQIFIFDEDGNRCAGGNDVMSYILMQQSPEDKRHLIEAVFPATTLPDGKAPGIYVYQADPGAPRHRPKKWDFKVRGQLDFEFGVKSPSSR